jgi:hypothetical protein
VLRQHWKNCCKAAVGLIISQTTHSSLFLPCDRKIIRAAPKKIIFRRTSSVCRDMPLLRRKSHKSLWSATPIGRKIQACMWERGIASIDRIRDRMMPQLVAGHLSIRSCPGQGGCKGRTRTERDCSRSRQNQKNKAYYPLKFPGRMTSSSDTVGAPFDIKVWFGRHTGSPSHGSSFQACPGSFSPRKRSTCPSFVP